MPGTTKKPAARRKRQPTPAEQIADLTEANRILSAENDQLRNRVQEHVERAKWAEEARASARESSTHLAKELEHVRKERDLGYSARLEVARLEGVLQGLERAGKIEPHTDVHSEGPWPR